MADATPIHPLRQRLIDDMTLRGFIPATQRQYIRIVRNCAAHAGKAAGDISADDARAFLLHLQGAGASVSTINAASVALRFFLRVTLGRPQHIERIPLLPEAKRIPSVLTPEEVSRILAAAPSLKWRAALSLAYGAGLRAAEVCNLKVADIDGAQMRLRVVMGKRRKDRYAKLSPSLLELLRMWWKSARPPVWLFPSRVSSYTPVTTRSLNRSFHMAKEAAGDGKQRFGGDLEQRVIDHRFVGIGDVGDRRGQREDDMIIGDWQQLGATRLQPIVSGRRLTFGTVAVAA